MIKVNCNDGTGNIELRGNLNQVLNEFEQLVKYMILLHDDMAIMAMVNGVDEAKEELERKKHE